MPFGAALLPRGGTRFRLWAPSSPRVDLQLQTHGDERWMQLAMHSLEGGWHETVMPEAGAGSRYKFVVQSVQAGGRSMAVPDPASRSNPDGVHGASTVVDPLDYDWVSSRWRGRPFADAVLYELHVGTFTEEGTFAAAGRQLADLKDLGITALQLMPLAAFPGRRNWGYDGVLPFAPAECYGRPDELKALIDRAHAIGLMVFLDVVYNHFGPEGNYLHAYCPQFFNAARQTPWGGAINFDGEGSRSVRDFFVHNALYWLEEYRFDGLRLDAVHAIKDDSNPDFVQEIARAIREGPGREREVHLVLENHANQAHYLDRGPDGSPREATAQWDDDVHHSLHVLTSGEADGYYADFSQSPLEKLGRALAEGFAYQGEYSSFRGKTRGEPSRHLPPSAFVGFLQNHDMVGNRAFGERIQIFADERLLPAAYACLLLTPQVPMLFMGEEFSASTPFMFFCDFGADLAQSVSQGRRREFRRFAAFADDAAAERIPDPNAATTFDACKLRWSERERPAHRGRLELIRELLNLRRHCLAAHLPHMTGGGRFEVRGELLHLEWRLPDGSIWRLLAHFGKHAAHESAALPGDIIYSAGMHHSRLEPGAVIVSHAQAAAR
jgi:maltooligosyltrehalose trehalohydrolase